MKVLIPFDGSRPAERAVAYTVKRLQAMSALQSSELHLLNVQPSLTGTAGRFLKRSDIDQYHRDEGVKALDSACRSLDAAGVKYSLHIDVGRPAEVIDHYARELGVDEIAMGTRGHGNLADLILGSTSEELLRVTSVPVLLVK